MALNLLVYHGQKQVFSTTLDGPLEIGRQQTTEPAPYSRVATPDGGRLVIAGLTEASLSRRHVRLEPRDDGRVHVENLSQAVAVGAGAGGAIEPNSQRDLQVPFVLTMGDRSIHVALAAVDLEDDYGVTGLAAQTLPPGRSSLVATSLGSVASLAGETKSRQLIQWLQAALDVFQSAASSPAFFERAARAVVELVGLDVAAVMRWDGRDWRSEQAVVRGGGEVPANWRPSRTILERTRRERRTFRRAPLQQAASLLGVEALVAAPLLDATGKVVGALYGDRRQPAADAEAVEITELEAMLVELIASGVAAGLARLDQERSALAARVRFEQFFTPELAEQLELQPDLLSGKDVEISVLFCDVRGFSRISERLGPVRTVAWISDVMEELSECVLRHDGVLVDYVGDELIAMWGAPVEQSDHAPLACRAALAMSEKLAALNGRWVDELGEVTNIGIGVNSGIARVGNTGSSRKFKYGPLGNTVNLASRVQGATKHMRSRLLVTGETVARLGPEIPRRRLSRVRVVNIDQPVDLFELVPAPDPKWLALRDRYETALAALERKEFLAATKHLGNLVSEYPHDGPSQLLLARAVNALIRRDDFDHVWNLESK